MQTRVEHDLLGELEVPADAYYGIHTVRASHNFQLSAVTAHPQLVRALAEVKKACALANLRVGVLDESKAKAIAAACDEIAGGKLADQFITDALQGGAGTSVNMNANEVIANRAIEHLGGVKGDYKLVHPNDHVNLSQSTNDAVPTAIKLAAIRLLAPAGAQLDRLLQALEDKAEQFADVLKVGRTEMRDAVPITLGQGFGAWACAVQRDRRRLDAARERLLTVNLGGTAIGTGLNADPEYVRIVAEILGDVSGIPVSGAKNLVDSTQNVDDFVEVSGLLKAAAVNLHKISADLRIMSSGPRAGIGEVHLPALQAGSSIMPGKVNPVATEAVSQAAFQVISNDGAITLAAMNGQLELNAFLPALAYNLFQSLDLLRAAAELLADRCISGITADEDRCVELLENSFATLTAMTPHIGYQAASEIAVEAQKSGKTVRQAALDMGVLTAEQLDCILSPSGMTRPGIARPAPKE